MTTPRFAVVGHPNKGKSSIVATLAQDDSVYIDRLSGTTRTARRYPMRVDDEVLYELIDTPGFQRARAALAWLEQHCDDVSRRPKAVADFCRQHHGDKDFFNECELLQPLVEGAGIIYVVDGSRPYGPEYMAEMEILRWTGRPSLALINPIDNDAYVADWENALGQYFKTVRVFNAHWAEFDKRIDLLRVFGQLHPAWQAPLDKAVACLLGERKRQRQQAGELITELLAGVLRHRESQRVPSGVATEPVKKLLAKKFEAALRKREQQCRRRIEEIYSYYQLQTREAALDIDDADLFDQQTWYLFGLTRTQLVLAAAGAGASAGFLVDAAVGGHSLLGGTILGGLAGGYGGWHFSDEIAKFSIKGLPTGGQTLSFGPVSHPNFPFVVLGRALRHHRLICNRTHAVREPLAIDDNKPLAGFSARDRTSLAGLFRDLGKYAPDSARFNKARTALRELVTTQLGSRVRAGQGQ